MTSNELKEKLNDLTYKLEKHKAVIAERLIFLCNQYPDAPISKTSDFDGTIIKASALKSQYIISTLPINLQLKYIDVIEKHIAGLQKHVQTSFNF